jgi:hypothetical protein
MGRIGRLILIVFAAVVVCVGLGFVWGVSGRAALESSLAEAKQDVDLSQARGELLEARVSLYNNNFGDASRHLEDAKAPLGRLRQRYQDSSKRDAADNIGAALDRIQEAQRLAGKLDPAANSKTGEALEAIRVATQK